MSVDFVADETNILGKEQIDRMFAGIGETLQKRKEILLADAPQVLDPNSTIGTIYSAYLEYVKEQGKSNEIK